MKKYEIKFSEKNRGNVAIVGHVGLGHVHSHSSFVQDDSAGFAAVASIIKEALNVNTIIKTVTGDLLTGIITVETLDGGMGMSHTRRGLTPYEIELLKRAVGEDGIYTQAIAIKTFGRMYGQGVMETPVALQGAIALAVMDSFYKKSPNNILITSQKYENSIDKMAGTIVDINGIPVSLLLNINGSDGGIGPVEDNEGNTSIGQKGEIMKILGIDEVPNIIVESKAYIPALSKEIMQNTFLFRGQYKIDNLSIAEALAKSASTNEIPYILKTDSLPISKGHLKNATINFAQEIITLGEKLAEADSSIDKVSIVADIAKLISEDAGGITFMSNDLHDTARAAGIMPGTASVISLLVSEDYINYWKIPILTRDDIEQYLKIIVSTIALINNY